MRGNLEMPSHEVDDGHLSAGQPGRAGRITRSLSALTKGRTRKLLMGIAVAFLLAVPQLISGNFWMRVLVQAGLGVMLALGLNVIIGYAGLLNLGYVGFYAIGAYTYALLASPFHDVHLPFVVLFPLAGILSALVGALLAIPVLPLRGDYLAMVTLGFGEITRLLINNLGPLTNGPMGIISIDHPTIFSYVLTTPRDYYYVLLFLCIVEVFLMSRLERSRIGRAWTAIREDESAASAMGIDTIRLKVMACTIGAFLAGLAGVLYAGVQTFVSPRSFTLIESIGILSMVIVGGTGSVAGVVLGALLLTILPEPLRKYTESYRMLIYGALLVLFALFRPQGIWPKGNRVPRGGAQLRDSVRLNEGPGAPEDQ